MIKKELSITELFGILSVIALTISVFSNAFFYYSLDAIWVMSILSPSFYIFEILKVLVIMCGSITVVGFLMDTFKWLIKKSFYFRQKKHFKLSINDTSMNDTYQKILKLDKSFQFWQTIFIIAVVTVFLVVLTKLGFIGFSALLWNSVLIGLTLGIFTNKDIKNDKVLKIFILIIFATFSTCFSAQIKLNNLEQLPIADLKNNNQKTHWYVLDGSQDKLVLLERGSKNVIKIVKFEEIDRIISNKK